MFPKDCGVIVFLEVPSSNGDSFFIREKNAYSERRITHHVMKIVEYVRFPYIGEMEMDMLLNPGDDSVIEARRLRREIAPE